MRSLGYKSCLADPDLWMGPQIVGDFRYYSYILCYADSNMAIHHDAHPILYMIDKYIYIIKIKGASGGSVVGRHTVVRRQAS